MQKIINFIKTVFIYLIGSALTKIISFLLLPIYTSYLSPQDYGYYDLSFSLLCIVIPVLFLQIWDGVFRLIYDYDDEPDKTNVVSNGLFVFILSTGLSVIIFFIIKKAFTIPNITLIFLFGLSMGVQNFYSMVTRALKKNYIYVISSTVGSIFFILINILLIVKYNKGYESLYIAFIISTLIQVAICEIFTKCIVRFRFSALNKNLIATIIKYSVPLCGATIFYWLITGFSKLYLSGSLGIEFNGIYSVANRFSSMIVLFVSVFQLAWNEMAFSLINNRNKSKYYKYAVENLIFFVSFGTILLIPITRIIFNFFVSDSFDAALNLIPIIYFGTMCNSIGGFISTLFLAEKQSISVLITIIISAALSVILTIIFVPVIGIFGAASAISIGFLVIVIIRLIILKNKHMLQINTKKMIILIILYSLVTVAFYMGGRLFNAVTLFVLLVLVCMVYRKSILKFFHDFSARKIPDKLGENNE